MVRNPIRYASLHIVEGAVLEGISVAETPMVLRSLYYLERAF